MQYQSTQYLQLPIHGLQKVGAHCQNTITFVGAECTAVIESVDKIEHLNSTPCTWYVKLAARTTHTHSDVDLGIHPLSSQHMRI